MAFSSDNVRVFLAVLDAGSFSAAARQLGRVPSAVSMAIAHLEAELDVPLVDRKSGGVSLTVFGQVVIAMLIQAGGLGFMTFAVVAVVSLGAKIGLVQQKNCPGSDESNQPGASGANRQSSVGVLPGN